MIISKAVITGSFDSKTISSLKNFAFLFMLIDHIGVILYPEFTAFRMIGRIAFPLFAFLTVYNFTFNSSNRYEQIKNIYLLAVISQYAYVFAFDYGLEYLNIFFLFLLVLTTIYLFEESKNIYLNLFGFIVLSSLSFFAEYGFFGYFFSILIYIFMRLESNKFNMFLIFIFSYLINGFNSPIYSSISLLITCILIMIYVEKKELDLFSIRFDKYLYYAFYPLHLMILFMIDNLEEITKLMSFITI